MLNAQYSNVHKTALQKILGKCPISSDYYWALNKIIIKRNINISLTSLDFYMPWRTISFSTCLLEQLLHQDQPLNCCLGGQITRLWSFFSQTVSISFSHASLKTMGLPIFYLFTKFVHFSDFKWRSLFVFSLSKCVLSHLVKMVEIIIIIKMDVTSKPPSPKILQDTTASFWKWDGFS